MAKKAAENKLQVASLLRESRELQQLTIEAVSKDICVRSCYLEAIEAADFAALPEKTFAVGFVKSYAKLLGLDAKKLASAFKKEWREWAGATEEADLGDAVTVPAVATVQHVSQPVTARRWPAWLSPVVGLVGASVSWLFLSTSLGTVPQVAESNIPAVDPEIVQLAAVQARLDIGAELLEADSQPDSATDMQELEPAEEGHPGITESFATASLFTTAANASENVPAEAAINSIELAALEDSWIKLAYADGTELWSGILREGQTYRPSLSGEVLLTTSNAGGLVISHADSNLGPLGARGELVADLALKLEMFGADAESGAEIASTYELNHGSE